MSELNALQAIVNDTRRSTEERQTAAEHILKLQGNATSSGQIDPRNVREKPCASIHRVLAKWGGSYDPERDQWTFDKDKMASTQKKEAEKSGATQ